MKGLKHTAALLLAACLLLTCAACGGPDEAKAASMWLVKTEGTVAVTDDEGADVSIVDRLGLFSGYGVATQAASYGWIDLDDTKLTKMDENSDVEVRKDGKALTLTVNSGSLFFHVTQPLADDETMEIRSSTMVTAIRGTCGWVEVPDPDHMNVYILEGTVECSVGDVTESVTAGQTAAISAEEGTVTVDTFSVSDIPAFVVAEVEGDEALCAAILEASGLDVLNGGGPVELALEQYRAIVAQADTYDYGGGEPTGEYRYALVQMEPDDAVPTLLLEQGADESLYFARVFQYDPEGDTVLQPNDVLMEGVALIGGFRGGLSMEGDGHGICITEVSSGTGATDIQRVTLEGNALRTEAQWSGRLDQDSGVTSVPIDWHGTGDLSALDSWTPGEAPRPAAPDAGEPALPEDGDRIVLTGTLNEYSYEETIALQGVPDPNAQWADTSQTFWIIVLDEPQTIEITSGGDPGLFARETSMVAVLEPAGLEQYAGQHITFSIDPHTSYWQSDTSMPMGAARTNDVHVLR